MSNGDEDRTWNQSKELSNGQVIAVAAAACGAAAWAFHALTSKDDEHEKPEKPVDVRTRLHTALDSDRAVAAEGRLNELVPAVAAYREKGEKAIERLASDAQDEAKRRIDKSRKTARRVQKDAKKTFDHRDREMKKLRKSARKQASALQDAAATTAGGAISMSNEHLKRLQQLGNETAGAITETLKDSSKDAGTRVAEIRDQVVALAKASGDDVSGLVHDVREEGRELLPGVAQKAAGRVSDLGRQVRDQVEKVGQTVPEPTGHASTQTQGDNVVNKAQASLHGAGSKVAGIAGGTLSKVSDNLGPIRGGSGSGVSDQKAALLGTAGKALSTVQEHLDTVRSQNNGVSAKAKDKSLDLAGLLQSGIPAVLNQVSDLLDQASNKSSSAVSEVKDTADDQMQSALERLTVAAKQAAHVGDQAVAASQHFRGASKQAAHRTADAGRDGVEALIWMSAAGVALYYGVLNPEQRQKVARVGMKAGRTVASLLGDVRGRDGQF